MTQLAVVEKQREREKERVIHETRDLNLNPFGQMYIFTEKHLF